jgi:hypothetical protein
MSSNLRSLPRVLISLSCTFGVTEDAPRRGATTSLSLRGCFVKTKAKVTKDDELFLKLWLPEQRWLALRGTVLYDMEGIGFGLAFTDLTLVEESIIGGLVAEAHRIKTIGPGSKSTPEESPEPEDG